MKEKTQQVIRKFSGKNTKKKSYQVLALLLQSQLAAVFLHWQPQKLGAATIAIFIRNSFRKIHFLNNQPLGVGNQICRKQIVGMPLFSYWEPL
jgi:hypothetical protein